MEVQYPITFDYIKEAQGTLLRFLRLAIGDWNMDTTASVSIVLPSPLAANYTNIMFLGGIIFADSGMGHYAIGAYSNPAAGNVEVGLDHIIAGQIQLNRRTGGPLDAAGFSSTPFNRGYILIAYW